MSGDETARWFQRPSPLDDSALRLVCFPHAGGSASFFREWSQNLPGIEVLAVRYPGRAERIDEAPPTDLRALAADIAAATSPFVDRPLALLGHSMGAPIAFEVARCLERAGLAVAHLFVSGSRDAPCPPRDASPVVEDGDAVMADLVRLGGMDAELARDALFRELVLPYVLADGRMFHAYEMDPEPRLQCPITAMVGDADVDADLRPWHTLTVGGFHEVTIPGDHFYLTAEPPYAQVLAAVGRAHRSTGPEPSRG